MRVATWNVNSVRARLPRLLEWLAGNRPDVVCLQEIKCEAAAFPHAEVAELGYTAAVHGDGRWNGVALLGRTEPAAVSHGFPDEPGFPAPETRAIAGGYAGVRIWSVYVPNGRTPDSPHYAYKLRWLAALRAALAADLTEGPVLVCGDFNIAPQDADVWDRAVFVGATHVTDAEREALATIRATGFTDVVPRAMKGPHPFTYWDYRAGMFHQNKGMRIDLVYASADLGGQVRDAYVDREARKGKGPSDHAPVIVDLDWPADRPDAPPTGPR